MHPCTSRARRSSAHCGRAFAQNPSSSVLPPSVRSVCLTQQPSRWTILTEVQAKSALHTATTLAIPPICPSPPVLFPTWRRPVAGARTVGGRTDLVGRTQLLDQVRKPERAHGMIPERGDGCPEACQRLRTERTLDLLEMPGVRPALAHAAAPHPAPEIVEVRQPLAAGDCRPLAGVEPHAGAGRAPVEVERLPSFDARAHQQPLAARADAGPSVRYRRSALRVDRRGDEVLLDR